MAMREDRELPVVASVGAVRLLSLREEGKGGGGLGGERTGATSAGNQGRSRMTKVATSKTKRCARCECVKSRQDFTRNSAKADGLHYYCKACIRIYDRARYLANIPYQRAKTLAWRDANPERWASNKRKWYHKNGDRLRPIMRERSRLYNQAHRAQQRLSGRRWKLANPDRVRADTERYRPRALARRKERLRTDIHFRLKNALSRRLRQALTANAGSGSRKAAKTVEMIGCSVSDLRLHLEARFTGAMSWENHGTIWHIDHIMPCASFDLSKPEHQFRCFHFSNLQPLLALANMRKGARAPKQFQLL